MNPEGAGSSEGMCVLIFYHTFFSSSGLSLSRIPSTVLHPQVPAILAETSLYESLTSNVCPVEALCPLQSG